VWVEKRERQNVSGRNTEGTRNMWGCKSTEKESEKKCYVYKGIYKKGDKHDREKCYLQKRYMYHVYNSFQIAKQAKLRNIR